MTANTIHPTVRQLRDTACLDTVLANGRTAFSTITVTPPTVALAATATLAARRNCNLHGDC